MISLLLDKGANPNILSREGMPMLYFAVKQGDIGVIKMLLEKNADVNVRYRHGKTPLFRATEYYKKDLAKILRDAGDVV